MSSVSDVPFRVAEILYGRVASLPPGSEEAETAEYAILYALSDRRTPLNEPFFLHDVLRDARKSVFRDRRRQVEVVQKLGRALSPSIRSGRVGILASGGTISGFGLVVTSSPEDEYLAQELEQEIRARAACWGPVAERCLDGMLVGETVRETADALDVSPRTVDRTRERIRAITLDISREGA